jgi:biotin synthase
LVHYAFSNIFGLTMLKKWTLEQAKSVFNLPFNELIYEAQTIHRKHFTPNEVQISTLLSIKTGSCPENCSYCPQSAHYQTGLKKEPLMSLSDVLDAAQQAKDAGATRFCMGAAWRGPRDEDLNQVCSMISKVKKLGLETCATLGLLKDDQALRLKEAGLDFYNHNIDTSEEFYEQIITTRTFQDRIDTLNLARSANLKICCGGIIGIGDGVVVTTVAIIHRDAGSADRFTASRMLGVIGERTTADAVATKYLCTAGSYCAACCLSWTGRKARAT